MVINERKDIYKINRHSTILIMLPFAGGNTYSYNDIIKYLPKNIEVVCPELPGRGSRLHVPLITDMDILCDYVFDHWVKHLPIGSRYIVYGHSMGALLGFLLTRKAKESGMILPEKLILSGREGPRHIDREEIFHTLPSSELREKLKEMGGMPDEILANDEIMEYLEPIFRADFKAIETYNYLPREPLDIPIHVLYGKDEGLSLLGINSWQEESKRQITTTVMEGNHFFILRNPETIANYLNLD